MRGDQSKSSKIYRGERTPPRLENRSHPGRARIAEGDGSHI